MVKADPSSPSPNAIVDETVIANSGRRRSARTAYRTSWKRESSPTHTPSSTADRGHTGAYAIDLKLVPEGDADLEIAEGVGPVSPRRLGATTSIEGRSRHTRRS